MLDFPTLFVWNIVAVSVRVDLGRGSMKCTSTGKSLDLFCMNSCFFCVDPSQTAQFCA